jgi:RloB-like protein
MGSDRRNRDRRPARREPSRRPRKRILVLCEGRNTEPQYLLGFKRWCRNPLVEVVVDPEHGVPLTLVRRAKEARLEAEQRAARERDDNVAYDEVWCVFDTDEHPNLEQACEMARGNSIEVALSNPCFELWLLLHFRDSPGIQGRKDVARLLRRHVDAYDKHIAFVIYQPGYDSALARAKRLDAAARVDGEDGRNPTTGVHRLTESIRIG